MSTVATRRLTAEEYLVQERRASFKSEYFQGETFAMAGATREHNLITGNVIGEMRNQLRDGHCELYPSDMRVRVSPTGLYTYPDVSIVCGKPEFLDGEMDTLLNPTVLFEVLSESTEAYDRGAKSSHYRQLASLQAYVLIAQDRPQVDVYLRRPDGAWLLRDSTDRDGVIDLETPPIRLSLAEIYRQVAFEPAHR